MQPKLNTFQRVRELEGWHAVAFSAALVQRMQPNYALFCQLTEFADDSQFRNTLNSVWEWLSVPRAKINFSTQLDKVEEVTPDAADFDNYGVFPAIDAAISLAAVLSLILKQDEQGAVVVSKLSQGCVESFIEATLDEKDESDVKSHPLMQWEIEFQQSLLDALANMKPDADNAKLLKQMAVEEGVSNLGIEIN